MPVGLETAGKWSKMKRKGLAVMKDEKRSVRKGELVCPQCRKKSKWHNNPYRPFCSARCRSIDLGAWVEEEYRVPGENAGNPDIEELTNN
jgi:endogenous inhibitor of DNA gyrase (YacG/DUF329 family)